jgi:hypothetical protein
MSVGRSSPPTRRCPTDDKRVEEMTEDELRRRLASLARYIRQNGRGNNPLIDAEYDAVEAELRKRREA